ncbi:hypothetical protein B0H19DRAFT_1184067 [Mycena capillaripes]|nr:hypothetical protein B0H19DRAFT_1184067 [Mycena capillaripes]
MTNCPFGMLIAPPPPLHSTFMTMRALSSLPLDDDIVDRIMTFCPTFTTLQGMILASKAFYGVYQTHPKSITRAVTYNIVGPALSQALRVIRYPYDKGEGAWEKEEPDALATECPEDHDASVITADEKTRLQMNSKVVETLEDIYSLTQKDRTSKTSVLTSEESWRFRRAMYRIMHYCNLFPGHRYSSEDIDELGDERIQRIQRQRTAVLKEYPTDELLQIYAVVRFMRWVLAAVSEDDNQSNTIDILLSTGPDGAARAWEYRSFEVLEDDIGFGLYEDDEDNPLYTGYFALPLENIWAARKVKPPKDDEPATKWILDTVVGANDTCSQCATPGGLTLLTEANWHRLQIYPTQFLKNKLKLNSSETTPFAAAVGSVYNQDTVGPWITSIFSASRAAAEWDKWTVDLSYCQPCLFKFLEEHVWRWWLQERMRSGWSPPEDCWYGYNCNTMTHKQPHAATKNHLCVPIKGNP